MHRRSYLALAGTALAGAAGCSSVPGFGSPVGTDWAQALLDSRNANYVPGVDGPVEMGEPRSLDLRPPCRLADETVFGGDGASGVAGSELDGSGDGTAFTVDRELTGPLLVSEDAVVAGYRNENGAGVLSMDRDDGSVQWSVPGMIAGPDHSAPAARGRRIVGPYYDETEGVIAVDAVDGSQQWVHGGDGAWARPAVGADRVYFNTSPNGGAWSLVCLDAMSGDLEWREDWTFEVPEWPGGGMGGRVWMEGPPVLDDERVYVAKNRHRPTLETFGSEPDYDGMPGHDEIYAHDRETGEHRWTATLDGIAAGHLLARAGEHVYSVDSVWNATTNWWTDQAIQAVDAGTGERVWRTPVGSTEREEPTQHLLATDAHLYVALGDRIVVLDRSEGSRLNSVALGGPVLQLRVTDVAVVASVSGDAREPSEIVALDAAD